jgi:hypothetical protein
MTSPPMARRGPELAAARLLGQLRDTPLMLPLYALENLRLFVLLPTALGARPPPHGSRALLPAPAGSPPDLRARETARGG